VPRPLSVPLLPSAYHFIHVYINPSPYYLFQLMTDRAGYFPEFPPLAPVFVFMPRDSRTGRNGAQRMKNRDKLRCTAFHRCRGVVRDPQRR
jgi:hypothetical protein